MLSRTASARPGPRSLARRPLLLAAALFAAVLLTPLAGAQERKPEIAVLHTAAQPQPDAASLPLSVFFTLRDQNGAIVPRSALSLDGAKGQLTVKPVGGQSFAPIDVTVTTPQTPIKIALVIDRSGSMNRQVGDGGGSQQRTLDAIVRDAAVKAVESAPPQAEFAVFSFAEKPEQQSDGFLRRADQSQLIADAIRRFTTNQSGQGNTCISDAALAAMSALNAATNDQAVERKAVILFTDGLDKEANAEGNPNNCTNADFSTVINTAQLSSGTVIPIYTIWPCDQCDENQRVGLEQLARETRGASAVGALQEVDALFQQVMELLNSQWVVNANVIATKGENTATLELQLDDGGSVITAAAPFVSDRDYLLPPQITVGQQRYDEATDTYKVTLSIVNPENIGQVLAAVYDQENGGVIVSQEQRFDKPGPQINFDLPSDGFEAGRNYFLRITAADANNQPLKDANNQPLLIVYPFTYEPKLGYTLGAVKPEWGNGPLVVEVTVRGAGQRDLSFSGEIINRGDGSREKLELTTLRDGQLRFPMPAMLREASGPDEYEIVLRLEEGSNVIEQRTESPVTLTPPPPESPNLLPYLLGGLGVVLVGVLGSFLYLRSRPKQREIPLPYNSATMLNPQTPREPGPAPAPAKPSPDPATPPAGASSSSSPKISTPLPVKSTPPTPVAKSTPSAAELTPMAAPTEVRSPASATVVHSAAEPTVVHVEESKPRLRIKVLKTVDPAQVREQTLDLPCTIGREQVSFAISGDVKISRRHAEIRLEGDRLLLSDLKSTNGTSLRGQPLEPGGTAPIEGPTEIGIGPNTLVEVERQ